MLPFTQWPDGLNTCSGNRKSQLLSLLRQRGSKTTSSPSLGRGLPFS